MNSADAALAPDPTRSGARAVLRPRPLPAGKVTPPFCVHFERGGQVMVLTTPTTQEHYFSAAPAIG